MMTDEVGRFCLAAILLLDLSFEPTIQLYRLLTYAKTTVTGYWNKLLSYTVEFVTVIGVPLRHNQSTSILLDSTSRPS
jgi:hypothetical protein